MTFLASESKLHLVYLAGENRVLKSEGKRELITTEVFPSDTIWYRLVLNSSITINGVQYPKGLHLMQPTEGGNYEYSAGGEDVEYIDFYPGENNIVKNVYVINETKELTAEDNTLVLIHRSNGILNAEGENLNPMYILNPGETVAVNLEPGEIVGVLEFE